MSDSVAQYGYKDTKTGRKFYSPVPLSPDEVAEVLNSPAALGSPTDGSKPFTTSNLDLAIDTAKQAVPGMSLVPKQFGEDAVAAVLRSILPDGWIPPTQTAEQEKAIIEAELGTKGYQPINTTQELIAGGVRGAVDPINLMLPSGIAGKAGRGVAGGVLEGASRAVEGFLGGSGGELGSQIVEENTRGPGYGSLIGGVVGGSALGAAAGATGAARRAVMGGAQRAVSGAVKTKAAALAEVDREAVESVQYIIDQAAKADPDFLQTLIRETQRSEALGIDFPTAVLTGNNPVIQSAIATIAFKNPDFLGAMKRQYDDATKKLRAAQEQLFGDPTKAQNALKEATSGEAFRQRVANLTGSVDSRIAKESGKVKFGFTEPNDVKRMEGIMRGDKDPISPEASRLYKEAFDTAGEAGTVVNPDQYANITSLMQNTQIQNMFQTYPELNKMLTRLSAISTDGLPLAVADIDSLKREVNKALRSTGNEDNKRVLRALRSEVDNSIKASFPEDAFKAYKAADDAYSLGINAQSFAREAMKDGLIDPQKARKWMEDNQQFIRETPGLADFVGNPSVAVGKLMQKKDEIGSFVERASKSMLLDLEKKTPKQLVDSFYGDPAFRARFINKHNNKPAMTAMRSYILDDMMEANQPMFKALQDKTKAEGIRMAFGKDYATAIENLVDASAAMSKSVVDRLDFDISKGVPKDFLEKHTGIPIPMVASRMRNQIISAQQAVIELLSRSGTELAARKTEEKMALALLDPNTLKTYVKTIGEASTAGAKIDGNMLFKVFRKIGLMDDAGNVTMPPVAKDILYKGARGGVVGGVTNE